MKGRPSLVGSEGPYTMIFFYLGLKNKADALSYGNH